MWILLLTGCPNDTPDEGTAVARCGSLAELEIPTLGCLNHTFLPLGKVFSVSDIGLSDAGQLDIGPVEPGSATPPGCYDILADPSEEVTVGESYNRTLSSAFTTDVSAGWGDAINADLNAKLSKTMSMSVDVETRWSLENPGRQMGCDPELLDSVAMRADFPNEVFVVVSDTLEGTSLDIRVDSDTEMGADVAIPAYGDGLEISFDVSYECAEGVTMEENAADGTFPAFFSVRTFEYDRETTNFIESSSPVSCIELLQGERDQDATE